MVMPNAPLFEDPSTWALTPCEDSFDVICSHIINLLLNKTVQLVLMSNLFSRFYDEAGVHGNGDFVVHIHGQSVRVVKIGDPIVDSVTGTIIYRGKDIHWMKNRICTKFALCKPVANIDIVLVCTHCVSGGCQVCTKCANLATHHLRNGCKPWQD